MRKNLCALPWSMIKNDAQLNDLDYFQSTDIDLKIDKWPNNENNLHLNIR